MRPSKIPANSTDPQPPPEKQQQQPQQQQQQQQLLTHNAQRFPHLMLHGRPGNTLIRDGKCYLFKRSELDPRWPEPQFIDETFTDRNRLESLNLQHLNPDVVVRSQIKCICTRVINLRQDWYAHIHDGTIVCSNCAQCNRCFSLCFTLGRKLNSIDGFVLCNTCMLSYGRYKQKKLRLKIEPISRVLEKLNSAPEPEGSNNNEASPEAGNYNNSNNEASPEAGNYNNSNNEASPEASNYNNSNNEASPEAGNYNYNKETSSECGNIETTSEYDNNIETTSECANNIETTSECANDIEMTSECVNDIEMTSECVNDIEASSECGNNNIEASSQAGNNNCNNVEEVNPEYGSSSEASPVDQNANAKTSAKAGKKRDRNTTNSNDDGEKFEVLKEARFRDEGRRPLRKIYYPNPRPANCGRPDHKFVPPPFLAVDRNEGSQACPECKQQALTNALVVPSYARVYHEKSFRCFNCRKPMYAGYQVAESQFQSCSCPQQPRVWCMAYNCRMARMAHHVEKACRLAPIHPGGRPKRDVPGLAPRFDPVKDSLENKQKEEEKKAKKKKKKKPQL